MLAPQPFTKLSYRESNQAPDRTALNRLFAAAIVSRQFRDELLAQPRAALDNGYSGETFSISDEEKNLILSIRAQSLPDLARQVNRALKG